MENELVRRIELAKTDRNELDKLLNLYMPFIKKTVSSLLFKSQDKQDYLTEAMLAFCSCVRLYNEANGNFISYANTAIRNRLIDCVRKEKSSKKITYIQDDDEEESARIENEISLLKFARDTEEAQLKEEIELINSDFGVFGFSWDSLRKVCPRRAKTREICFKILKYIASDEEISSELSETKELPVSKIANESPFPRRILRKYRTYITALFLISRGDYPFVRSYMSAFLITED